MWKSGALQSISDFEEANAEHARFLKAAIRAEVCPLSAPVPLLRR